MTIKRIDPPLPVVVSRDGAWKSAQAHFLIDYGFEHNLYWVCFMDDTGECWTVSNTLIRAQTNITAGREPRKRATHLSLALPTITIKGQPHPMATFPLPNNATRLVLIQAKNEDGIVTALPSGRSFDVTSSDPTNLEMSISADASGNPAVLFNPIADTPADVTMHLTDVTVNPTDGPVLIAFDYLFSVVDGAVVVKPAVALFLDPTTGVSTPKAAPAAAAQAGA